MTRKPIDWTPRRLARLRKMLAAGASVREVADAFQAAPTAIYATTTRYGIKITRKPRRGEVDWRRNGDALRVMVEAGTPYSEIAARFGCAVSAARAQAHKMGVRQPAEIRASVKRHQLAQHRPVGRGSKIAKWCPEDQREFYLSLKTKGFTGPERRAIIEDEIARVKAKIEAAETAARIAAERAYAKTWEGRLERARTHGITERVVLRSRDYEFSLTGSTLG